VEDRILARRASGKRVILPVREGVARPRAGRLRGIGAVAALALLCVLGGLFYLHNLEARAQWSELVFDAATPEAGDRVQVTFRPALDFGDDDVLVLRGRVSGPLAFSTPPPAPRRLAILRRSGSVYEGTLTLSAGIIYAQVAVEDTAGARVDDGGGRLWHFHRYDCGRPDREALWAHALLTPDWEDAYEVIRWATELYPGDARLLAARLSHELDVLPRAERDSALAAHREAFPSAVRRVSERDRSATARDLAGLVEYARTLGDSAAARQLTARLVERFPLDSETVWYRVPPPPDDRGLSSLREYLATLETLWREAGPHPAIASPGFWTARQLGDAAESVRWARRQAAHPGWFDVDAADVAVLLADVPGARTQALHELRREIQRLHEPGVEPRPLDRTVREHRRDRRDAMRPLLAKLSELLLAEGKRRAALDTLRIAASIGWSPSLHLRVAELELATGDTLAAALSFARASTRPVHRAAEELEPGSGMAVGAELVGVDEWRRLRRASADERYRTLLARSEIRELRVRPVHVYDSQGGRHTLGELSGHTVTVVAFWEPSCGPAVRDLPDLHRTADRVRALGGELITVTEEPPGERLSTVLAEHQADLPLYHDLDRSASAAFQQYGAPEYFVLDPTGRIRFSQSDLGEVVAQVDALLNEPRLYAAAPGPEREDN
jgi:hypothetical protein